jgi:hypothetical protein
VTNVRGLLLGACAVLALAGATGASAGLTVGVTEDTGKGDGGATFFATLANVGLKENRVSILWNPASPMTIGGKAEIDDWLPQAQVTGTRVVFAIAAANARDLTSSPDARGKFAAFVRKVAQNFPTVRDYVIGNEPNQPRFWLPQFAPNGTAVAAAQYLPVLADAYDALKAVNPTINVIGLGLSPRGNDRPSARDNISRSPVRFLRDLGRAYKHSGRTKPLMDELAFHPYPSRNIDPPDVGYAWPNAGLPNLDRIKQAVWDAFNGTAQPVFAEPGKTFARPLQLDLDEVGWQVAPLPALASLYYGVETPGLAPVPEDTQAAYYRDTITLVECDPAVRMLSFFHLADERDLRSWQSGLLRANGSRRPSYDAVKQTIATTKGECQEAPAVWRHTKGVVLPVVAWGNLKKRVPPKRRRWSFRVSAGEEATFKAGVFKAGPRKAVLARRLARGRPKPILFAKGTIKAKTRVVYFPARRLKAGRYVYAIRMTATMNPKRATVFVSRAFRVGPRRR